MKKFTKNIAKEFKHSFGRFIAIMAIVALGVGFLIGVMQATPDMKRSMDIYYRENSAYDADVKGTLGLTEADISAIGALDEVEKVTPVISTDALVSVGGASSVSGRIIGRSFDDDSLNTLTLEEGRFPASDAPGEAVVERSNKYFEKTDVEMYAISEEEIAAYIATGEPMDKAGAYGIQGKAAIFVRGIRGDYNTVVGLPAARVYQELKAF